MQRRGHGQLKASVLRALGEADGPLTARELLGRWPAGEPVPALTTVLTVLERLRRADVVVRFVEPGEEYRFATTPAEPGSAAESMLGALLSSADRSGALLTFAGRLTEDDLRVLRRAITPEDEDGTAS